MDVYDSVETISGVGPALAKKLRQAGLSTVADCLAYAPRRYDDFSHVTPIVQLRPGPVSVQAKITSVSGRYVRRGMHVTEAIAQDGTGSVRLVWFNQPYRARVLKQSAHYFISGEFKLARQRFSIMNPAAELVSGFPRNAARIIPVYRESYDLKSNEIRRVISACLPFVRGLPETLPAWLVSEYELMEYAAAVENLHFPASSEELAAARQRYGFEEVFQLALAALLNKRELQKNTALQISFNEQLARSFVSQLPFTLTDDQRKSAWRIFKDMQRTEPMNRLLEGDVGSGKTVVATMAAIMAIEQGYQVALMAPTELLARQHAETVKSLLAPLTDRPAVGLLTGGLKAKDKSSLRKQIETGKVTFIVGTHALITDAVEVKRLGLVIVDEQHRFGVEQRKRLQQKAGHMPHVLHMTATPIPRSLALTLYGELDVSILKHKPSGRKPIETKLVPSKARAQVYREVEQQLQQGRQVFVVCPLIKKSDAVAAQSVNELYESLRTTHFKYWRVGLLHGKLSSQQKETVMNDFAAHKLDILVTTTVIEVGVDVPNASVMLIEGSERFGLAQAHQLRGRVGRSTHQGYCYLLLSDRVEPSRRLRALASSNDGFRLAELDLEIRGPGSIYGTFQHGALDLRVASLSDQTMIENARNAARTCVDSGEDLLQYPYLQQRVQRLRSITNLN